MMPWNTELLRKMSIGSENEAFKDISITVSSPRTHIHEGKPHYTDYLITVKTCNMAFSIHNSKVRRRYSEFEWLRETLAKHSMITKPPELPPKQMFRRFERSFVLQRQKELEQFLNELIRETTFLSDATLHLFLQSQLNVNEINFYLCGLDHRSISSVIVESYKRKPQEVFSEPMDSDSEPIKPNSPITYTSSECDSGICSSCSGKTGISHVSECQCGGGLTAEISGLESPLDQSFKEDQPDGNPPSGGAVVLQGGRLVLSRKEQNGETFGEHAADQWKEGSSTCRCSHVIHYDADDEANIRFDRYDIVDSTAPKKRKSRKYLDSISPKSTADETSSTSSGEFNNSDDCQKLLKLGHINMEYDVIDSDINVDELRLRNGCRGNRSNDCYDSDFSAVHSCIDEPVQQTPVVSGKYEDYDVIELVNINN